MKGRMNSFNKIALVTGLMMSLAACSESGNRPVDPSDSEPTDSNSTPETTDSSPSSSSSIMTSKEQIAYSIEDLSGRLNIDSDEVSLSSARTVRWRSGARGCPEAGMMYTQALVPGVSIQLLAGGETYHYHAVTNGQPFFCPEDRVETPVKGSGAD
jgi:hypothetical protein